MEFSKEEREIKEFSWSLMFIVTGCSSFIFSITLKLLDGNHSRILLFIGIITVILGLLNWLSNRFSKKLYEKK